MTTRSLGMKDGPADPQVRTRGLISQPAHARFAATICRDGGECLVQQAASDVKDAFPAAFGSGVWAANRHKSCPENLQRAPAEPP